MERRTVKNPKNTHRYIIYGQEAWVPYRKHGYSENGRITDSNYARSKAKSANGKGKGGDGKRKMSTQDWQCEPIRSTRNFIYTFLESKICALDGTDLGHLRGGLGLCSSGIILPGKDNPKCSGSP